MSAARRPSRPSWPRPRGAAASCARCAPRSPARRRRAAAVLVARRRHGVPGRPLGAWRSRRAGWRSAATPPADRLERLGGMARRVDRHRPSMRTPWCSPLPAPAGRCTSCARTTTRRRPCWTTSPTPRSPSSPSGVVDAATSPLLRHRVPRAAPEPAAGHERWAVTACTYLSRSGPTSSAEGEVLLRASVGRYRRRPGGGVERRGGRASGPGKSSALLMGVGGSPLESMVTRWPHAFPQYRVHHLMRTAGDRGGGGPARWHRRGRRGLPGRGDPGLHRQREGGGPGHRVSGPCRAGRPHRRPLAAPPASCSLSRSRRGAGGRSASAGAALLYWRLAGLRARTRCGRGGSPVWAATGRGLIWARAFNWYGAVVAHRVEALFFAAAAAAHAAAARAGAWPSSPPAPWPRRCA